MFLTPSHLYNYLQCPHIVWRDLYGPQEEKIIEPNPFVQLLWERGVQHEKEVVEKLGDILDLKYVDLDTRFNKTLEAMDKKVPLIYQGVLQHGNLRGIPDLLQLQPDGSYIAIDIKSGRGYEGMDDIDEPNGKPKKHYAVQLAMYCELLQSLDKSKDSKGIVWGIDGQQVEYDLTMPMGKRLPLTWNEFYYELKHEVTLLMNNQVQNKPALSGNCKMCPWNKSCKKWCIEHNDCSCVFYIGHSKRKPLNDAGIETISDMAEMNVPALLAQKKKGYLDGLAEKSLVQIKRRAEVIWKSKQPVAYAHFDFPKVAYELFFDIEDDPTQDFVYLHGIYERSGQGQRYLDFTATENSQEAEMKAWSDFWKYIRSLPENDFAVYYYSPHEKSMYRHLQQKYPQVISAENLEAFFDKETVIDLYHQVLFKLTDWPLSSYSLKEIASYLGFKWRDKTPSGALSIEWYNKYLETRDHKDLVRILEYNEDDCIASMVIKDKLSQLLNS